MQDGHFTTDVQGAENPEPGWKTRIAGYRRWFDGTYLGQCLIRIVELRPFDRALALASRAFVALLPLAIVSTSLSPAARDGGFAQGLIDRFQLSGDGARLVRQLFATPNQVRGGVTILGLLVLIYSVFGFARLLARLYEDAWRLPRAGVRGMARALLWIGVLGAYMGVVIPVRKAVSHDTGPFLATVAVVATIVLIWLLTPYLMLAGRIPYRSLLPTAIITAAAMLASGAVSEVYMPSAITTSGHRYGLVGVSFSLVSWLIGISLVLLVSAAIGAVTAERWLPPPARDAAEPATGPAEPR
jgi:membrane protein